MHLAFRLHQCFHKTRSRVEATLQIKSCSPFEKPLIGHKHSGNIPDAKDCAPNLSGLDFNQKYFSGVK